MKRWHLVELEDLPWVPRAIRDGATDVLDWMFAKMRMYGSVVDKLRAMLDATGEREIVDICSGGAGGALAMHGALRERGDTETRLLLTDVYPNHNAAERIAAAGDTRVRYHREPVDALSVPSQLRGVRTMYSALHHFRPDDIRRLVAASVADRAPIAFFDVAANPGLRRTPGILVPIFMLVNVVVLLVLVPVMVLFVRPVRVSRLFFTYVIPAIPMLYAWDGTVSGLRAYTPAELTEIARSVPGADGYVWDIGCAGSGLRSVVFLTGRPAARA